MAQTRRDFLRTAACALGGAALASTVESFGLMDAYAQSAGDYRALVCVFLNGGNDGNNMVVPLDPEGYGEYSAARASAGLAIARPGDPTGPFLLPISPASQQGRPFGLHPSMPEMKALFDEGRLAVVCNTGPLIEPLTRTSYRNGTGRKPLQLFSHSDQVALWQTSIANSVSQTGWGGRMADRMAPLNSPSTFSHSISIAGVSTFLTGSSTRQLAISDASSSLATLLPLTMTGVPGPDIDSRRLAFDQIRRADLGARLVKAASDTRESALQTSAQLSTVAFKNFSTIFPATSLGRQLLQVGRLIAERRTFGMKRQVFFVQAGGYDTHTNQRNGVNSQDNLLLQLSQALNAFNNLLRNELGNPGSGFYIGTDVTQEVTTFTLSDFGRTLQPAGAGPVVGSDHGWGNHHLVLGGAVRGGDFYGTFPTLRMGDSGPDDADTRGRWIPTTSVEQYAATLASWYGLPAADFPAVFPLLDRFPSADLGFMS